MGEYSNEFIIRAVVRRGAMQIRGRTTVCVNGFSRDKCVHVHSSFSYFSRVCDVRIIGALDEIIFNKFWNYASMAAAAVAAACIVSVFTSLHRRHELRFRSHVLESFACMPFHTNRQSMHATVPPPNHCLTPSFATPKNLQRAATFRGNESHQRVPLAAAALAIMARET